MKYLIASDIHGSAYFCEKLINAFKRENADKMILLGDILYHGPRNDLPKGYAPKEVIALLIPYADRLLCVRGNCDTEVDQMVLPFPILADYALLSLGEKNVFITHGHNFNKTTPPPLSKSDILLHGHTHIPVCEKFGEKDNVYINPGSVSIPKEGSANSYMTLKNSLFIWKDLDGNEYMRYDA